MKYLFLLCLLAGGLRAAGQVSPLPIDSLSGRVTYRGTVEMPGASAAMLFGRAQHLAATSLVPAMIDAQAKTVSGVWEKQLASGRTLRYEGAVFVSEGRYRYELSDFENKTAAVHYAAGAGVQGTAPGGTAPLERVLANPSGYRKGKPVAALLDYRIAVHKAATQAVADLRQSMMPNSH